MTESISTVVHENYPETDNGAGGLNSRDKLLRSAEELFSSREYRSVSVRAIAAHAGVNPALVRYYFRGKQELFLEVFRAHTTPLAQELMRQLEAITKDGRIPSVEEILKAWLIPWMRASANPKARAIHLGIFANMSREEWEGTKGTIVPMQSVHMAFIEALHACLPHLAQETVIWRLHFVMGALVFGATQPVALLAPTHGRCDPRNLEASFDQILPYAIAGFNAQKLELRPAAGN